MSAPDVDAPGGRHPVMPADTALTNVDLLFCTSTATACVQVKARHARICVNRPRWCSAHERMHVGVCSWRGSSYERRDSQTRQLQPHAEGAAGRRFAAASVRSRAGGAAHPTEDDAFECALPPLPHAHMFRPSTHAYDTPRPPTPYRHRTGTRRVSRLPDVGLRCTLWCAPLVVRVRTRLHSRAGWLLGPHPAEHPAARMGREVRGWQG